MPSREEEQAFLISRGVNLTGIKHIAAQVLTEDGTGKVRAFQDSYGAAFARLQEGLTLEDIVSMNAQIRTEEVRNFMGGSDAVLRVRPLRPVDAEEVLATIRKFTPAAVPLADGQWYEVHAD